MNIDQQRAAFEAWIKTHCDYEDLDRSEMMLAFDAWQAALASPEVQALRKDAERYRWIFTADMDEQTMTFATLCAGVALRNRVKKYADEAIDAAMEKQK